MTSENKLDLYLATNLEELNKLTTNNSSLDKLKLSTCANIMDLIDKTWAEAKKAEMNHDEERAYVLYMRTYTCFTALKQTKDAANNQGRIQYYQKGAQIWYDKAKELVESLGARYDRKNAVKIEEERKIQAEIDEENSLEKSITPKVLYKYLYERKKNILLIDMRLKVNYDQSHMKSSACIHIPADLMNGKGWTSWGVEGVLTDGEALTKFKQRANFDYIVLFDDGSYMEELTSGSCLMGLKQAIFILDRDVKLKHEPLILQGGYEDWMSAYPGLSTAPLISKEMIGELRSFEISYPDDKVIPQEVPSDAATVVQPEVTLISPTIIPQVDRTRKPISNQKPESPTIEKQDLPIKPSEDEESTIVIKDQPEIPDRSIKPIPPLRPSSPSNPQLPFISDIPPRSSPVILNNHITPEMPKPILTNETTSIVNGENPPKIPLPNRETLSIYRPFNRTVPINNTNEQYQKKFDAVTGRKIFVDTKTNRIVPDIPESETIKVPEPSIPTVNRDNKPILTEQTRRQIAYDYRAVADHSPIKRPTGLKNLGNSCYMNSVIQSLSFHFQLTNYFLSGEFLKDINSQNKLGSGGTVVKQWFYLNSILWSQQYSYLVPQPFKSTVGRLQQAYLGTQQQDAHEFLVFLLDCLHEDLNQTSRPRLEEIKSENYSDDRQLAEVTKQAFHSHNRSIIIELFYGLFKSITICQLCSYQSIRFEAFAIISVPIPRIRQCTLNDCLELFRDPERLTGDDRYECSKCKRLSEKNRQLAIWELPKIFIVHFKRFRLQQSHYIKNETLIRYPIFHVDFSRWSRIKTTEKYSLVSVVNHYGSLNSGHYTSYCHDGKQWYYCDDQSIRSADIRELENNVHAYLLFYSSIPQPQLRLPVVSK